MATLKEIKRSNQGQAVTEYILMISMIAGFYFVVIQGLAKLDLEGMIKENLLGPFTAAYKYGHPKAKGPDEGGAQMHPRFEGKGNFRIFYNPDVTK